MVAGNESAERSQDLKITLQNYTGIIRYLSVYEYVSIYGYSYKDILYLRNVKTDQQRANRDANLNSS